MWGKTYVLTNNKRMKWIHSDNDSEKEQIKRFICFLGRRQNRSPNSIRKNVKTPEGNVFILIIFIYVLFIEEYKSP